MIFLGGDGRRDCYHAFFFSFFPSCALLTFQKTQKCQLNLIILLDDGGVSNCFFFFFSGRNEEFGIGTGERTILFQIP